MTSIGTRQNQPELNSVFTNFALTIMSSWIVGPTGVLLMHVWGWGSNAILVSILLALGAGSPVQLLLNEFVAAGATANSFRATRLQVGGVMIATAFSIWWALISSTKLNDAEPFAFCYAVIALLTATSIWLSYRISLRYYRSVMSGATGKRASIYVGITPGLVTLASFLIAASVGKPVLLLVGAIMPAVAQMIILNRLTTDKTAPENGTKAKPATLNPVNPVLLIVVVAAMIAVGFATTIVRDYLAGEQADFAALILVSLNLLGTVVISFSRALYLTSGRALAGRIASYTLIVLFAAIILLPVSSVASALVGLFGLQMMIVTILATGRRFSDAQHHLSDFT